MRTIGIIPARMGSSRFPEKPLVDICGCSMVERVWRIAAHALGAGDVYVATDNNQIRDHVMAFGGQAIMTSADCRNGSERVAEAMSHLEGDIATVINIQGDSPLLPSWIITDLKHFMDTHPSSDLATPAVLLSRKNFEELTESFHDGTVGGTYVTVSLSGRALYFSKAPIPCIKRSSAQDIDMLKKHIGVYAYRPEILKKLVGLSPTPLEQLEQLEQLRALENDIPIDVVMVDYRGRSAHSVDNPMDLKRVEEIIEKEGELL